MLHEYEHEPLTQDDITIIQEEMDERPVGSTEKALRAAVREAASSLIGKDRMDLHDGFMVRFNTGRMTTADWRLVATQLAKNMSRCGKAAAIIRDKNTNKDTKGAINEEIECNAGLIHSLANGLCY
jgi:hypothetical protein